MTAWVAGCAGKSSTFFPSRRQRAEPYSKSGILAEQNEQPLICKGLQQRSKVMSVCDAPNGANATVPVNRFHSGVCGNRQVSESLFDGEVLVIALFQLLFCLGFGL
jgi:hypothetical protein